MRLKLALHQFFVRFYSNFQVNSADYESSAMSTFRFTLLNFCQNGHKLGGIEFLTIENEILINPVSFRLTILVCWGGESFGFCL